MTKSIIVVTISLSTVPYLIVGIGKKLYGFPIFRTS